jgi:hypothetical protein
MNKKATVKKGYRTDVAYRLPSLASKPLQLLTEMTETEGVRNTNTMELMILIH